MEFWYVLYLCLRRASRCSPVIALFVYIFTFFVYVLSSLSRYINQFFPLVCAPRVGKCQHIIELSLFVYYSSLFFLLHCPALLSTPKFLFPSRPSLKLTNSTPALPFLFLSEPAFSQPPINHSQHSFPAQSPVPRSFQTIGHNIILKYLCSLSQEVQYT